MRGVDTAGIGVDVSARADARARVGIDALERDAARDAGEKSDPARDGQAEHVLPRGRLDRYAAESAGDDAESRPVDGAVIGTDQIGGIALAVDLRVRAEICIGILVDQDHAHRGADAGRADADAGAAGDHFHIGAVGRANQHVAARLGDRAGHVARGAVPDVGARDVGDEHNRGGTGHRHLARSRDSRGDGENRFLRVGRHRYILLGAHFRTVAHIGLRRVLDDGNVRVGRDCRRSGY